MNTDTIILAGAQLEITAAAGGEKPATFTLLAYDGGPMQIEGFGQVLIDLEGLDISRPVKILVDHENKLQGFIGTGNAMIVNSTLRVDGTLTRANPTAVQVIAMHQDGIRFDCSVGVSPGERDFIEPGKTVRANGRSHVVDGRGLWLIRQGILRETSLLPLGASVGTSVSISATQSISRNTKMTFEEFLTAKGFCDPSIITREMQLALRASYDEQHGRDDPQRFARIESISREFPFSDHLQTRAAELKLRALDGTITAAAYQAGLLSISRDERDLERIRGERPRGPGIHAGGRDLQPTVIEAALARSIGLPSREKAYKPEVLEAADRLGLSFSLQELLLRGAEANGYTGGRHKIDSGNIREVLRANWDPSIRAGFSTLDVAGILSNLGNKASLDGFGTVEQTWRDISGRRSTPNFKTMTVYRMTDSLEYEELPPSGEIKHGTLGEESYSMSARTYAKMAAISRQDIINDDLGVFNSLRMRLGRGAGLKLNNLFWTTLLDDASFFTDARGNLITDTLTSDPDCLNSAVAHFAALADSDGNPLGFQPSILLTGPSLAATARRIFVSSEIRDTTASTATATANVWQGMFKPLMSAYLEATAITGYSATAWWLLCNPAVAAVIDVCFLDGQESPTIESSDADFDTLGIHFRGYHDFGVAKAEYRAGVKSTGAGA